MTVDPKLPAFDPENMSRRAQTNGGHEMDRRERAELKRSPRTHPGGMHGTTSGIFPRPLAV